MPKPQRQARRVERQPRKIDQYPAEKRRGVNGNLVKLEKGERLGGREKGTPNRITRTVKDWLLAATEASGHDGKGKDGAIGYLVWLSRNEPVAYAALLGRVIPMQIQASLSGNVEHSGTVKLTADQLAERLKARGLPVPTLIEHDPNEFDLVNGKTDVIEGNDDDE